MTGVAELDEVQYDLEVDGEQVRRQLSRKVWERGGWATIAITFVERDKGGEWKPAELALLRFRKLGGAWQRHAAVTAPLADLVQFLAG
ncbi:MAG TPA: hypothetical protein VGL61_09735 [Kofleriaceae bacterium]|jgi:hypothetical protein